MWTEQRNGKYRYFERYTDPLSGKLRKVSVTLSKKSDTKAAKMLSAMISEKTKTLGEYTLGDAAKAYLDQHKKQVRKQTYIRNARSINYTVDLLGRDNLMDRLTAAYIWDCYSKSDKSVRTENENMSRFKTFIRWAYRHDYVSSTACIDKLERFNDTPIRERIQDKFLNRAELSMLLDSMPDEGNRLVTEFLALSGLRIGELVALNDSDVTDVISVTKTYSTISGELSPGKTICSRREVHVQPELASCISRIRIFMKRRKLMTESKSSYFVIGRNGGRFQYYAFNKYFKEATEKILGRSLSTHALRHTHASLLAESGVPLDAIKRRLGHEDSRITEKIYLHITEGTKKKDADILDTVSLLPPSCPQKLREAL